MQTAQIMNNWYLHTQNPFDRRKKTLKAYIDLQLQTQGKKHSFEWVFLFVNMFAALVGALISQDVIVQLVDCVCIFSWWRG